MATALKLKSDIKKLKAAINSKATPKNFVPKLKSQLEKAETELANVKSGGKPKRSSAPKTEKTLTALQKLVQKKKFSVYKGAGVDLKKDAGEGALKTGRRVSKGLKSNQWGDKSSNKGNVYYEYRPNRLDVKQPKKQQTYPKLEDGGMMAMGGEVKVGDILTAKTGVKLKVVEYDPKFGGRVRVERMDEYSTGKPSQFMSLSRFKMASGGMMAKGGVIYEVGIDNGKDGTRTLADFEKEKDAKNFIYDYNLRYPNAKLFIDTVTSDSGMMAKGGNIDYSKQTSDDFKLGEIVWDVDNKTYGTIIGIYDEYASDKYEVRLDSDGMQPTENLRKVGSKGDEGKKEQLNEAIITYSRLIKDYPKNNYPKQIEPMMASGGMTKEKSIADLESEISMVRDEIKSLRTRLEKEDSNNEMSNEKFESLSKRAMMLQKYVNEMKMSLNKLKGNKMADGGELHRSSEKYAEGGETKKFSEREFKDILDEALEHFYMGLNKIDSAMRYLEVKGQAGLKNPFAAKIGLSNLKESIEKIDEYTSKK